MQQGSGSLSAPDSNPRRSHPRRRRRRRRRRPRRRRRRPKGRAVAFGILDLAVQIEGAVSPSGLPNKGGEHEARVVSKFAIYYSTVQLCSTVVCSFYKVS